MTEGNKVKVLLVEDYAANVIVAGALLEDFGYEYEVAKDGETAIQMVKDKPFNLVLMDVQMPGIDGFKATQLIRQWEKEKNDGAHIPIIGMTAHALSTDRARCIESGMDDYISKPYYPDEFKSKIEKNISH